MEHARPASLNDAGTLNLLPDEVEFGTVTQGGIDLYDGATKTDKRRGVTMVTAHRLAWLSSDRTAALEWHLSQVVRIETEEAGFFVGSAKIVVHVTKPQPLPTAPKTASSASSAAAAALPPASSSTAAAGAAGDVRVIKLSFKLAGRDEVLKFLSTALASKKWIPEVAVPPPAKRLRPEEMLASGAFGVAFIENRQKQAIDADKALTERAFADLSELEKLAKPLVALAESYAKERQRKSAAAAAAGGDGTGDGSGAATPGGAAAETSMSSLIVGLGIVNPVTKASAGNMYLEEVARQLAVFLRPALERSGGMMALTDVYCIYNRARVTELISPDDLLEAAKLLQRLRLGCALRTFPSGLMVIQLDSFSEDAVVARVVAHLTASVPAVSGAVGLWGRAARSPRPLPHALIPARAARAACFPCVACRAPR